MIQRLFTTIICFVWLNNTVLAGQYFNCNDMDHFSIEGKCKNNAESKQGAMQSGGSGFTKEQIEMWAEPTVDENGKVVSKLPPLPVLKALTDPSEENIKAYLEWNEKRMKAIERASNALNQLTGQSQEIKIDQIKKVEFYFSPT